MTRSQIFFELQKLFEFKFHSQETIHTLKLSKIFSIISFHFHKFFLSYRTINHNHKKSNQLTIQYNNPIHSKIWTIITKLQNQIQKLKNNSCRRNCSNFINFLSIQLQIAENQKIRYTHKLTSNMVLNMVMMCQIHIGSHLILLWINPKTQAQIMNRISNFRILTLEQANKYNMGNNPAQIRADIKIHQFWLDDNIQK